MSRSRLSGNCYHEAPKTTRRDPPAQALARPPRTSFATLKSGSRTIFTNPNAKVCYAAVFIEGCCVLGLFPFIAAFLFERAFIPNRVDVGAWIDPRPLAAIEQALARQAA